MKSLFTGLFLGVLLVVVPFLPDSKAQSHEIDLQIQAEPILTNSQVIQLTNLFFDKTGHGSRLFSVFLANLSDQSEDRLYLDLSFSSRNYGLIAKSSQVNIRPISLQSGQTLFISNNHLASGNLPGINEHVSFIGDLTDIGYDFLNDLEGSSHLPFDEYTLTIELYQGNNRLNGGNLLASNSITIGSQLTEDDFSLHLLAPGDEIGAGITISNPFPEFRWEGRENQTYRVIVVEERDGESPETLIQSAKSSSPGRLGQSTSLFDYEMFDILTEGTILQYPPSGVQQLQRGKKYYWQVFSLLESTSGQDERASEIWSFTLNQEGVQAPTNIVEIDDELQGILIALIGMDAFRELERQDFELLGLEIEGELLEGVSAREQLIQIAEKIREGQIKIRQ